MQNNLLSFIVFSLIALQGAGCSKKENPIQSQRETKKEEIYQNQMTSQDQLKLNTIRQMYADDSINHDGNQTLYQYMAQELKDIIDAASGNEDPYCVADHDVLMQSQDPDYENTQFKFSLNDLGLVQVNLGNNISVSYDLECNDEQCQIADVFQNTGSMKQLIQDNCLSHEPYGTESNSAMIDQEQTLPNIRYRIYDTVIPHGSLSIENSHVEITSLENQLQIKGIKLNRGNCSIEHFSGKATLGYGQSIDYFVHPGCPKNKIFELEIELANGQVLMAKPNG